MDVTATTTPQRVSLTFTWGGTGTLNVAFRAATAGGAVGDILVGAAQVETGSRASSLIITVGATATRAADAVVVPDSGWAATEGTIAAEWVQAETTAVTRRVAHSSTSGTPNISTTGTGVACGTEGVFSIAPTASIVAGTLQKAAYGFKAGDHAATVNAGTVATSSNASAVVAPASMSLGVSGGGSGHIGHITRIRYTRRRVPNGQLQGLSA